MKTNRNTLSLTLCALVALALSILLICPAAAMADVSVEPGDKAKQAYTDAEDPNREVKGVLSVLNPTSNNPYHNQIRLNIDVGTEFATFVGSDYSEGYIVKCTEGDTVTLPVVTAKPGYTFIGWSLGNVPEEPEWGVFTTDAVIGAAEEDKYDMAIYALYMDDEGNGYCTCGAYKHGVYADRIDEFKAAYAEYQRDIAHSSQAQFASTRIITIIALVGIACALLIPIIVAVRSDRRRQEETPVE